MSGETRPADRCAFCKAPTAAEELLPVAGLVACNRCRGDTLDDVLRAWGFEEEHAEYHSRDVGSSEVNEHVLKVELRRSGGAELMAKFWTEKPDGWFKRIFNPSRPDPEVGFDDFDDAVRIRAELDQEAQLRRVFQNAGAREAVMALVATGCSVELVGRSVFAEVRRYSKSSMPELVDVRRLCFALAIHLM